MCTFRVDKADASWHLSVVISTKRITEIALFDEKYVGNDTISQCSITSTPQTHSFSQIDYLDQSECNQSKRSQLKSISHFLSITDITSSIYELKTDSSDKKETKVKNSNNHENENTQQSEMKQQLNDKYLSNHSIKASAAVFSRTSTLPSQLQLIQQQ